MQNLRGGWRTSRAISHRTSKRRSRTFGEIFGFAIARALRDATHWLRTRAEHAGADSADWLRDEARLVVPRGELDDFLDEVDTLRERGERLQARVERLRGRAA